MKHVVPPLLVLAVTAAIVAALAPLAAADAVYHTEHLALTPVGGAPLRSGFVQNIKAEAQGLRARAVHAERSRSEHDLHRDEEILRLDPGCDGNLVFPSPVGSITTNPAGNGSDRVVVRPEEIPGFLVGAHGVLWTVTEGSGAIRYQTACTTVTLD